MHVGSWWHSVDHDEPCRIVETGRLWGQDTCTVWLPRRCAAIRVARDRLVPLKAVSGRLLPRLAYVAAGARIADALEQDTLVAPLEGSVIPLPHQLLALQRAISGDRIRYLLADEVGLGKTVEAGLILRELKIRGLVRRVLIVAPAGLVLQWQSEMRTHFNEPFRLMSTNSIMGLRGVGFIGEDENLWRRYAQVVCPLDGVKPMEQRRGWSAEQVARYNRDRFEDLVAAGWDLIIIDEAHRLAGSSDRVARFKLGEALSQAAPYLLLLSATPHQGKSDAFRRLIGFLDPDALPSDEAISREAVAPYVIRTEKRHAIDAHGMPLFKPRFTQLVPIDWAPGDGGGHREQQALYEAVTAYVRNGYNRAMMEKQAAIGFLMILMQRLVTSSTAAIRSALERRLEALERPPVQPAATDDLLEEWFSLDGQQLLDALPGMRTQALEDERSEVEHLLSVARRCEALGPDVKAEALLERIRQLRRDENDPALKVLVFTEFIPTQAMLATYLEQRGFAVACLNGSMDIEERRLVQQRFRGEAQVLISTDAGGEGLNLQFCHVVVNYDLPWNPMKIEQRIGRVDRIGQTHVVRAMNFALDGTVELRVRAVLEEKLQRILAEFGVDKLADVLDSEEGGVPFEELFAQAIIAPEEAERRAAALADEIRRQAREARDAGGLLGASAPLDPAEARRIVDHRMPFWTERLTLEYLRSREGSGAAVEPAGDGAGRHPGHDLRWPDGSSIRGAVFTRDAAERPGATLLSLEDPRVRGLTANLPVLAPGQPIPVAVIPGISDKVEGIWSLWRIGLHSFGDREQRYLPIFLTGDGRSLAPTARLIWDRLIELPAGLEAADDHLSGDDAVAAYETCRRAAEAQGTVLFESLLATHHQRVARERRKGSHAFASRRRAVERLGLPQVRAHRLRVLDEEERAWSMELSAREAALPDLAAILLVSIAGTAVSGHRNGTAGNLMTEDGT